MRLIECVGNGRRRGRTVTEISQELDITLPSVTAMVKRLEAKGYATKYPEEHFTLDESSMKDAGVPVVDKLDAHGFMPAAQQAELVKAYEHPILKKYGALAKEVGGHGGMDFVMDSRLVYCLQNGLPLDMDVYDLAEWCCLAELGTLSMDNNCASVAVPDFTRGHCYDQKGYRHAFATPEQEAQTDAIAKAYTQTLKTKGLQAAEKELKKALKKAAK